LDWLSNDPAADKIFRGNLEAGYKVQLEVATLLRALGHRVEVPPLRVREDISEIRGYVNTYDLKIGSNRIAEVKSRRLRFTSPDDYPFRTIFVDTVSGWSQKAPKPDYYIVVSRETGRSIYTQGKLSLFWDVEERFDRERNISDRFYVADRAQWRCLDCQSRL
jgi:hypothetical protein